MLHLRLVTAAEGGGWGLAALHTQPCTLLKRRRHVQPAIALGHPSMAWIRSDLQCLVEPYGSSCFPHSMHGSQLHTDSSPLPAGKMNISAGSADLPFISKGIAPGEALELLSALTGSLAAAAKQPA